MAFPLLAANVSGDRRSIAEAAPRGAAWAAFIVDQDHHPDANGATMPQKWCAVDPARATFPFAVIIGFGEPADLGGHAAPFPEGSRQVGADTTATADAVQERRLQDAWYT